MHYNLNLEPFIPHLPSCNKVFNSPTLTPLNGNFFLYDSEQLTEKKFNISNLYPKLNGYKKILITTNLEHRNGEEISFLPFKITFKHPSEKKIRTISIKLLKDGRVIDFDRYVLTRNENINETFTVISVLKKTVQFNNSDSVKNKLSKSYDEESSIENIMGNYIRDFCMKIRYYDDNMKYTFDSKVIVLCKSLFDPAHALHPYICETKKRIELNNFLNSEKIRYSYLKRKPIKRAFLNPVKEFFYFNSRILNAPPPPPLNSNLRKTITLPIMNENVENPLNSRPIFLNPSIDDNSWFDKFPHQLSNLTPIPKTTIENPCFDRFPKADLNLSRGMKRKNEFDDNHASNKKQRDQ